MACLVAELKEEVDKIKEVKEKIKAILDENERLQQEIEELHNGIEILQNDKVELMEAIDLILQYAKNGTVSFIKGIAQEALLKFRGE